MCDQQRLRSACTYAHTDQRICLSLKSVFFVKLLTEYHLEFLSLKGGCQAHLSLYLSKCHIVGNLRLLHAGIRCPDPPEKSQNIVFLAIMVRKNHKTTKPAFNVGHHRHANGPTKAPARSCIWTPPRSL